MREGASIAGKWMAMLKEIAPRLARAAALVMNPIGSYDYFRQSAEALAPSLKIELVLSPVGTAADIERAIESFARVPNGGLLLPPDNMTITHRDLIISLAARHRLPAVYSLRVFVAAGGLMSYGTDQVEMFRRRHPMSTASCAAPNPPTFRCRRRPSTKRSSTSRRRRRSA